MTSQQLGSSFEKITHDFFIFLFKELKIQINNNWVQKAGYQFGFDVGFEIAILNEDFFKRGIYIECKNYEKSTLDQGHLLSKIMQFHRSDYEKKDSIFIFLSPKIDLSKCTQDSNPKQLEDYFNQNSPFKTIILTPNNNIKAILSLNEEIFCKVYGEIYTELDPGTRNSILEYFEKLLYSKGEIPNFKLVKKRKEYLEQASKSINTQYISRKLKTNKFSFSSEDKNLLDLLKSNEMLLLLGEPGSGKTTELINISNYFEQNILKTQITPIFISLANVKTCLEDALPEDWMSHKKIVLLLDALDEFELKSQLAAEIERLHSNKNISFKIVVTSRTYAYGDELKSLKPSVFYLNNLNKQQSFELLKGKYKIPENQLEAISKKQFKDILEDPFMLNILGKYYENHAVLPQTTAQIYEDIKAELPAEHLELYRIISLILELTKKTSADKKELKNLLGVSYRKVKDLALIESTFDKESYKFIHKNYQEYFAASSLTELSFEQILDFISIKGVDKIHPTLFNTITFLINIVQGEKYDQLLDWLLMNNPELLIKADKNRIGDFRIKLFQNYFYAQCVEKTFWISSSIFSIKEIAEFGDCEDNYDYLVSIILSKDSHFRTIISALELLSFFTVPPQKKNDLKTDFLKLLQDPGISLMIKSHILDCIADQMLHEHDEQYLRSIFELFKLETNKQLNRSLLSLIQHYPDIDSFFWYVNAEFLREQGITQREVKDDVIRGTSWILEELIIKFKKSSHFIALARHYFIEQNNEYRNSYFTEKLLKRCLDFEDADSGFIIKLLSSFDEKTDLNLYDDTLKTLFVKLRTSTQLLAFDYLISSMPFEGICYFLGSVSNEKNIEAVIERFKNGTIDIKNLDYYRNVIANHDNRKLAQYFNDQMLEHGFPFVEKLLTEQEHAQLVSNYKSFPQKNFDFLFSRTTMLSHIEDIFNEYGPSIDSALIRKIQTEWYHKNGHGNSIDISISIIRRLIHREEDAVKFEDVENLLKDQFVLISEIQSQIKALNGSKKQFVISGEQKAFLNDWCAKTSKQIRFDRIIRYVSSDRYGALEDYGKFKAVMFFTEKIDCALSQDFLLNSIEFIDVNNSSEGDDKLQWLKLKIKNDSLFTRQIISNIKTKNLVFLPLNIHIQYALDNKLEEAYPEIRAHFLMPDYNYNIEEKLKQYIDLTNDVKLLKELCSLQTNHKFWSAIKILMNLKIEQEFCEQKAIEYLEAETEDESNYYASSATAILFELNSPAALGCISKSLSRNQLPSLNTGSFADYDFVGTYEVIEELFNNIYTENKANYDFHDLTNFIVVYIANLSRTKQSYDLVQEVLKNIKSKAVQQNNDTDLYHVNHLIDKSKTSYINSQSKALSFKEAVEKIENL